VGDAATRAAANATTPIAANKLIARDDFKLAGFIGLVYSEETNRIRHCETKE